MIITLSKVNNTDNRIKRKVAKMTRTWCGVVPKINAYDWKRGK